VSWRKRLLLFLGFWTGVGLLVHFGGRSNAVDHLLIAIWLAILIVGSVIVVFRRWPKDLRGDDPPSANYIGSLLPRRWQYWLMGEKPPEKSDKDRD
jgi:hypothetical protein